MYEKDLDKYWKTVVNTIQDGIMIIDKSGAIISANKALEKITGYTKKELIGRTCEVLNCDICEKTRENSGEYWCKLFRTGKMTRRKCSFLRKDGTYTHALKNATLLRDSRGKILGAVESVTDINEVVERDNQIAEYRKELKSEDGFHGLLGQSAIMQQTFALIENTADSEAPVIIFGESGTGKELVAKSIHETSNRLYRPFVKVNCAALTETLLESELFGHVKGAYTGAYKDREGRFEMAKGGSIFLDEIGDLPLTTQVKLLRVLEEKIIERVGDNKPIPVNVRIISATNRNLIELVKNGAFREDLYFRINVIPINIPPLRERPEDISLLAASFFHRMLLKSGKKIKGISKDVLNILTQYRWPGNVRELKSAFEYAFVTCHETMIKPYHLPPNIVQTTGISKDEAGPDSNNNDDSKKRELIYALEQSGGNQSEAARILGISRVTVWNRMKKYNIRYKRKISQPRRV
jgi:two-component system response regulator HydG